MGGSGSKGEGEHAEDTEMTTKKTVCTTISGGKHRKRSHHKRSHHTRSHHTRSNHKHSHSKRHSRRR